jgi:hypothetical protein
MKLVMIRSLLSLILLGTFSAIVLAQQSQPEPALTNAAVVKLAKAGFKEKTIISIIAARVPAFDLSTERMIDLKRSGVSEKIIVAMLARQQGMSVSDDEGWDEDLSFGPIDAPKNSERANGNAGNGNAGNGNSMDIFGSSGGAKGQTRTKAGNQSASGDTVTTGTATVRILRPPTEAGGASGSAKLEKVKTLTNDSIVELVEAGFSEGTIIRRIEQSPVDFDLSADKMETLRKRRVSDKILTAMKAAMGDESTK